MTADGTGLIPAWVRGLLQPVDKLEVHRTGLKHKAVSVFVLDGDRVLLQRRSAAKYHTPGLWTNTCCTHPLWGEAPGDCAVRRLRQELGVTGLAPEHREHLEYRADVGGGLTEHEVVDVFVAEARAESLPLAPNPTEVEATRWAPLADLRAEIRERPTFFTPWLRIYLEDHHAAIFGTAA